MFEISFSGKFKKDFKKHSKDARNYELIEAALLLLRSTGGLHDPIYQTHDLAGNYKNHYDSHLKPDLILIWKKTEKMITLVRLGSHSQLF